MTASFTAGEENSNLMAAGMITSRLTPGPLAASGDYLVVDFGRDEIELAEFHMPGLICSGFRPQQV